MWSVMPRSPSSSPVEGVLGCGAFFFFTSRVVKLLYQQRRRDTWDGHAFTVARAETPCCRSPSLWSSFVAISSLPAREALIASAIFRTPFDAGATSRSTFMTHFSAVVLEPIDCSDREPDVILLHDVLVWHASVGVGTFAYHVEVPLLEVVQGCRRSTAVQLWSAGPCLDFESCGTTTWAKLWSPCGVDFCGVNATRETKQSVWHVMGFLCLLLVWGVFLAAKSRSTTTHRKIVQET